VFEFGFDPAKIGGMSFSQIFHWQQMAEEWESFKKKARGNGQ
jgi:hypothetical protein